MSKPKKILIVFALLFTSNNHLYAFESDLQRADRLYESGAHPFFYSPILSIAQISAALSIYRENFPEDHEQIQSAKLNLATKYMDIGWFNKAYTEIIDIINIGKTKYPQNDIKRTFGYLRMADYYFRLGLYDYAARFASRSLEIRSKVFTKDNPSVFFAMVVLGKIYEGMGLHTKALTLLEQAYANATIANPKENVQVRAIATLIALIYIELKDLEKASYWYELSKDPEVFSLILSSKGDQFSAVSSLENKYHTMLYHMSPHNKIKFFSLKGKFLYKDGNVKLGTEFLYDAIQAIESLRILAPTGEKEGIFQSQASCYKYIQSYIDLIEALITCHEKKIKLSQKFEKISTNPSIVAFYLSESTKGRTLLESVARHELKNDATYIPDELKDKENKFYSKIQDNILKTQGVTLDNFDKFDATSNENTMLSKQLIDFEDSIRNTYPSYATLHYPSQVKPSKIPLKPDEVLFEYQVCDNFTCLFVVKNDGTMKTIKIPINKANIESKISHFLNPLLHSKGNGFSLQEAKELFTLLLAPALKELHNDDKVIIVPDGALALIPFEILTQNIDKDTQKQTFFGDMHEINYYQSASLLTLQRSANSKHPSKIFFGIGNPLYDDSLRIIKRKSIIEEILGDEKIPSHENETTLTNIHENKEENRQPKPNKSTIVFPQLSETEDEVIGIAGLLQTAISPPDILLRDKATKKNLLQTKLDNYQYIHLATHGGLAGVIPGLDGPFLVFGDNDDQNYDGFLTIPDVLNLHINAELVVLSGCLTGVGKILDGEGVLNFARTFQEIGAKSVILSLWSIDSISTTEFMKTFYGYLKSGKTKITALRMARKDIRKRYPNPYFWAPFILHGDG